MLNFVRLKNIRFFCLSYIYIRIVVKTFILLTGKSISDISIQFCNICISICICMHRNWSFFISAINTINISQLLTYCAILILSLWLLLHYIHLYSVHSVYLNCLLLLPSLQLLQLKLSSFLYMIFLLYKIFLIVLFTFILYLDYPITLLSFLYQLFLFVLLYFLCYVLALFSYFVSVLYFLLLDLFKHITYFVFSLISCLLVCLFLS